jgi:aspartyl-tRNA(Asn)/glutamyl-tRNA(Gln) amidotransferase subunit B
VRSAAQAREWLTLLRETLRQLGVSDVNMEEGSLRCDANVSIRPVGSDVLGTKTELKNMNSFRYLERGVEAEIARQTAILEAGGEIEQETLHYDPVSGAISSLRSKEEAHDYRYFPEPDLVPIVLTEEMREAALAELPELPAARAQRYEQLGLSADSARQLAFRADLAAYFERALAADGEQPQALANWVTGELVARIGDEDPAATRVSPEALAQLVALVRGKQVTSGAARQVLDALVAQGGDPQAIVDAQGLGALGGGDELAEVVARALESDPDAVAKLKGGNMKAIGPIVGFVMRETKGRADGGEVTRLVREQLGL